MRKPSVILVPGVLLLAALVGYCLFGNFEQARTGGVLLSTEANGNGARIDDTRGIARSDEKSPLRTTVTIRQPGSGSYDLGISSETGVATLIRLHPDPGCSLPDPETVSTPDGNSADIEISWDTGGATLIRRQPEIDHSRPDPADTTASQRYSGEFQLDPDSGIATLIRR